MSFNRHEFNITAKVIIFTDPQRIQKDQVASTLLESVQIQYQNCTNIERAIESQE